MPPLGVVGVTAGQGQWEDAFGALMLFLWTLALFYHLGNGVRHLIWDAGYGFEIETARTSATT